MDFPEPDIPEYEEDDDFVREIGRASLYVDITELGGADDVQLFHEDGSTAFSESSERLNRLISSRRIELGNTHPTLVGKFRRIEISGSGGE